MLVSTSTPQTNIAMSDPSNTGRSAPVETNSDTKKIPLGLPAPSDAPSGQDANQTIKLDHLGPMIVNSNGTISRISNWSQLTQPEKDRSLRLLAKRNNVRMEGLRQQDSDGAAQQ